MRAVGVWFGSIALVAAVSCAASSSQDGNEALSEDAGAQTPISDGGPADASSEKYAPSEGQCSPAGWCATSLPDSDLILRDISVFPNKAFAIADSPTLGARVLEWNDADAVWKYIDDGTQNESGLGRYVGGIWAPNEDEIYYTVSPGYVFYGTRTPSGAAWSWTYSALGDRTNAAPDDGVPAYQSYVPSLGVWGMNRDHVYAWFKNTIYHFTGFDGRDGGGPAWVAEYSANDVDGADEEVRFYDATGTSEDDVWFAGARVGPLNACAILVHRVSGSYRRVADGIVGRRFPRRCTPRTGAETVMIGGKEGILANITAVSPNQLFALKGRRDVVRISADGDDLTFAFAQVPDIVAPREVNALSTAAGDLWVSGYGIIARADDVWDGGKYELSTISLSGALLERAIYRVRGTSKTNMWAIGDRYALHKTTP